MKSVFFQAAVFCLSLFSYLEAESAQYGSTAWWEQFWSNSQGWGASSSRVQSLLSDLDGTKKNISVVDVGAGNGRNSLLALLDLFKEDEPQSHYTVHCFDISEEALSRLRLQSLPTWMTLVTRVGDVNDLDILSLPKADVLLLYGILEYVDEAKLESLLRLATNSLDAQAFLVVVTLVQGEGALEIDGELTRDATTFREQLAAVKGLEFVDTPVVDRRPDCHDLGKGYPEEHLHYVFRTVMKRNS